MQSSLRAGGPVSRSADRPRFAHGVALAALIPYAAMMGVLLLSMRGLEGEERAFRMFVTTIVGFAGVPIFVVAAVGVFGAAQLVLTRAGLDGTGAYTAWGAGSAFLLFLLMTLGGPSGSVVDELPALMVFLAVGAASGTAFRAGALRRPANHS